MSAEPLAEVYEKLKDLRRQGQLPHLNAIQPEMNAIRSILLTLAEANELLEEMTASIRSEEAQRHHGSLIRVLEMRTLAARVFGDAKKAEAWLNRTNPSFSGQRPIDLLQDELGAAVVREALEQIDHGIFA
jgi:putative toxin-antitoxin system antitoxin component (TIGR02293 family)